MSLFSKRKRAITSHGTWWWFYLKMWMNTHIRWKYVECLPVENESTPWHIHIYRSWVMALFLLENTDFLGFRIVFKVRLNQIFSNFNTMQCTIKYRLSSIMVKLTFTVHELGQFIIWHALTNVEGSTLYCGYL
jgi:hypothetical protein